MINNVPLIGIYAPFPRSGKGEVLKTFVEHGYIELTFARVVKSTMGFLLKELGYTDEEIRWYLYDDGKEEIIPLLGITGGQLLSTFATDFIRDTVKKDVWLNRTLRDAEIYLEHNPAPKGFILQDQRFENEHDKLDISIRMTRKGTISHNRSIKSEGNLEDVYHTYELNNGGTLYELRIKVEQIITEIEK